MRHHIKYVQDGSFVLILRSSTLFCGSAFPMPVKLASCRALAEQAPAEYQALHCPAYVDGTRVTCIAC